MRFYSLTLLAI